MCLKNPTWTDYRPLFTTEDEWTLVKYIMLVISPFQFRTLWMSKWQTVTPFNIITLSENIFNHMDVVINAVAKKKTQ